MFKTQAGRASSKILSTISPVIQNDTIYYDSMRVNSDGDIFFLTGSNYYMSQNFAGVSYTYPNGGYIVKINPNTGATDTTFMTNMGIQAANNTGLGYVDAFDIDPNTDDLIITGSFRTWNGSAINHTGIVRVDKTGALKSSFNTNLGNGLQEGHRGEFYGQVTGMTTDVNILSVQYNNSLITLNFNGVNTINSVITTYNTANPNATVYLSFGDGTQIPNSGQTINIPAGTAPSKCSTSNYYRCNFLANGKVLIMGKYNGFNDNYTHQSGVVLLNSNGTIDTSFSNNVAYALDSCWTNVEVYNGVELSTGSIVLYGNWSFGTDIYDNQGWDNSGCNHIIKVSSTGVTDSTFVSNIGQGFDDYPRSVVRDSSDNLYVGGYQTELDGTNIPQYLTKLSSAGVLNTTFNDNLGHFPYYGFNNRIDTVQISGTDLLVGGRFSALYTGDTVPVYTGTPAGCATAVTVTGTYKSSSSWFELIFDGVISINTAIANHNAANPDVPCSLTSGNGAQVPNNLVDIYEEGTDITITVSTITKMSLNGVVNTSFETNMGNTSQMYDVATILPTNGYYYLAGAIEGFNTNQFDTLGRINTDGTYNAWFYPVATNSSWTCPAGVTKIGVGMISNTDNRAIQEIIMDVTPGTTYTIDTTNPSYSLFNTYRYQGYNSIKIWWIE